jgi:hypothetical protein
MVKRGAGFGPVSQDLHVPNRARKIGRNRISDFKNLDRVIFGFEKMLDQVRAVAGGSTVL